MAQLTGIARLGRDAETRFTAGGDAVTELSLAFNYGKKDQDGKRPTQWVRATIWGDRGEKLAPHLLKGSQVYVILNDVHVRTYDKTDGTTGVSLEGMVNVLDFVGGREQSEVGGQRPPVTQRRAPDPTHGVGASAGGMADMDDDIPF